MIAVIQKMLAPVHRRVMLMVNRAVVSLVNDALRMQGLQVHVLQGEVRDGVERFQEYGFTSVPLPGAEAVMVSVAGNHDHGIVIAVDDRRYRLTGMQGGEVALYTDEGDKIALKRGKLIEVNTNTFTLNAASAVNINTPTMTVNASTKAAMVTPLVEMSAQLSVAGKITGQGGLALSGSGTGPAASITGDVAVINGDVNADGIGLKPHVHADAQGGLVGPAQ